MASLIPSSALAGLQAALSDHFDTFKGTIIVNKEPKKTVTLTVIKKVYIYTVKLDFKNSLCQRYFFS